MSGAKHVRVLFCELSPFPDGFPPGGGDTLLLLSRDVTARSPFSGVINCTGRPTGNHAVCDAPEPK